MYSPPAHVRGPWCYVKHALARGAGWLTGRLTGRQDWDQSGPAVCTQACHLVAANYNGASHQQPLHSLADHDKGQGQGQWQD